MGSAYPRAWMLRPAVFRDLADDRKTVTTMKSDLFVETIWPDCRPVNLSASGQISCVDPSGHACSTAGSGLSHMYAIVMDERIRQRIGNRIRMIGVIKHGVSRSGIAMRRGANSCNHKVA